MSKLLKGITEKNELVYEDLILNFSSCDCIKYSTYRTASKLHLIQRFLWFDQVSIDVISGVFTKHRIFSCENKLDIYVDELKDILYDIYFISFKDLYSSDNIRIDILVNICVKFLKSAFELTRKDYFNVFKVKVALVSLCSCHPTQKFKYWFSQLADHNLCLSCLNFKSFLNAILELTKYLSEAKTFCEHIVELTLKNFETQFTNNFGISEGDFLCWLNTRPHFLSWLLIFYRFCVSKNLTHAVKCSHCLMEPIIGLRYSCVECINYNLCHTCFFSGKTNRNHKTSHAMNEFCSQVSSYRLTSAYLKNIMKKVFSVKKKLSSSINSQTVLTQDSVEVDSGNSSLKSHSQDDFGNSILPSDQLNHVIDEIEKEAKMLSSDKSNAESIQKHTAFLHGQLKRLKYIQRCLENVGVSNTGVGGAMFMSTPLAGKEEFDLSAIQRSAGSSCPPTPSSHYHLEPNHSDFSIWIKNSQEDAVQTNLQADLDNVLTKLHRMLEKSFWNYD